MLTSSQKSHVSRARHTSHAVGSQRGRVADVVACSSHLVLLSYLFFPGELIPAPTGIFELRWWQIAILCLGLMFPSALLSGILFPAIAMQPGRPAHAGRSLCD
jgi:hypothetical protein